MLFECLRWIGWNSHHHYDKSIAVFNEILCLLGAVVNVLVDLGRWRENTATTDEVMGRLIVNVHHRLYPLSLISLTDYSVSWISEIIMHAKYVSHFSNKVKKTVLSYLWTINKLSCVVEIYKKNNITNILLIK